VEFIGFGAGNVTRIFHGEFDPRALCPLFHLCSNVLSAGT
jgi:hypothetical protein